MRGHRLNGHHGPMQDIWQAGWLRWLMAQRTRKRWRLDRDLSTASPTTSNLAKQAQT